MVRVLEVVPFCAADVDGNVVPLAALLVTGGETGDVAGVDDAAGEDATGETTVDDGAATDEDSTVGAAVDENGGVCASTIAGHSTK